MCRREALQQFDGEFMFDSNILLHNNVFLQVYGPGSLDRIGVPVVLFSVNPLFSQIVIKDGHFCVVSLVFV